MRTTDSKGGMTLVEILLTVSIIGMLVAILIPTAMFSIRSRENARAASKLRTAVLAFTTYRSETGSYPADVARGVVPPEMVDYFAEFGIDDWWTSSTELGGNWDWNKDNFVKFSVSIAAPGKTTDQLTDFDKLVDDGNLTTGKFCKNGEHYHYILEP